MPISSPCPIWSGLPLLLCGAACAAPGDGAPTTPTAEAASGGSSATDNSRAPLRPTPRSLPTADTSAGDNGAGSGGSAMVSGAAGAAGAMSSGAMAPGGGGAAGSTGLPEGLDPLSGQVCDAVSEVFAISCVGSVCHDNPSATGFMETDLSVYDYVGAPPVRNDPRCGLIIDPSDPEQSLLLTKLTGSFPAGVDCGARMPLNGQVSPRQVECLIEWLGQFSR